MISGSGGIDITRVSGVSIFDAGSILASGGTAIGFDGSGNTLTLGAGYIISGTVSAAGANTLQLGGSGPATFDLADVGSTYLGFNNRDVVGGFWTVTTAAAAGPSRAAAPWRWPAAPIFPARSVRAGGVLIVESGGTISGVTISSGGSRSVLSGGTGHADTARRRHCRTSAPVLRLLRCGHQRPPGGCAVRRHVQRRRGHSGGKLTISRRWRRQRLDFA